MKKRHLSLASAATAAVIALSSAPIGSAAANVQPFGSRETISDVANTTTISYTVTNLQASGDRIPWPVMGRLYESTVTVRADRGTVAPVIPMFFARSASGQSYRVLSAVATPLTVRPDALMQGQQNTGKMYFDVTGDIPNSVVYGDAMGDYLIWVGAPAAAPAPAPAAPAPAPAPAAPAPAPAPMMPAPGSMMPTPTMAPAVMPTTMVPPPPAPMMPGY